MPSLVIMVLQPACLLALLQALSTPPPSSASLASSRCERTGFAGWHSIPGAGAPSGGSATDTGAPASAPGDNCNGPSASRPMHGSHAFGQHGGSRVDTGVFEGLSVGHASVRDARLAVYIILLVKYRLDGAALEAGGGCKELQKVRLPRDSNMFLLCTSPARSRTKTISCGCTMQRKTPRLNRAICAVGSFCYHCKSSACLFYLSIDSRSLK